MSFGGLFAELDRDVAFEALYNAAQEALQFAMKKFPLSRPLCFEWKDYRVTAGKAHFEQNMITISKVVCNTQQKVWDTVLHEYAHLVVFERYGFRALPHGKEWKRVMKKLGVEPKATHDYETTRNNVRKRYIYVCKKCGEEISRVRPFKQRYKYIHVGCGGEVGHLVRQEYQFEDSNRS